MVKEVGIEYLGVPGINSYITHVSSSRAQMFCSHLTQALAVQGATKKRAVSLMEREFGKYLFGVRMPEDGTILKVIPRYQKTVGEGSIAENPELLVIYEVFGTSTVNCFTINRQHYIHKDFGFKYVPKNRDKLFAKSKIKKGTVFGHSPNLDADGDYRYGAELNTIFMSIPQIIEDGVVISRSAVKKLTTKAYGKRVLKFGRRAYPLNIYPKNGKYGVCPDIGDRIRADGLLFGLRHHDEELSCVEMTPNSLKNSDYIYDRLTYAEPNAKIVDIRVWRERQTKPSTPTNMTEQLDKYADASTAYYENVIATYKSLRRDNPANFRPGDRLQQIVVEAMADSGKIGNDRVHRTYRMQPLDEYRVEVTYEYDLVPTVGFKLTGCHGNKGVVCDIWEDEWMPVDEDGNRAEIIMDGHSITKRMNPGVGYESYFNGASRDVSKRVREIMGFDRHMVELGDQPIPDGIRQAVIANDGAMTKAWELLIEYYQTVAFDFSKLLENRDKNFMRNHVASIIAYGIYLVKQPDESTDNEDAVWACEHNERLRPFTSPVTYRGYNGKDVTTVDPIDIYSTYIMLLEKTGENWAAVASARLQHFGIPAKLTNEDKYSSPAREQPVRADGESEIRGKIATIGSYMTANILDMSTNPVVHKQVCRSIIRAQGNPNDIDDAVDRNKHPIGNGRPLVFYRHILECGGVNLVRRSAS